VNPRLLKQLREAAVAPAADPALHLTETQSFSLLTALQAARHRKYLPALAIEATLARTL
jgi:hypothetical protein